MIHGKICNQLTSNFSEETYKNNKHISLTFYGPHFDNYKSYRIINRDVDVREIVPT